ncbi:MAG: CocE/NonD family hydrolase [Mycobacterium sp.]|nr:CocE/NonD family hydrolase [Mycobacterium sp.]
MDASATADRGARITDRVVSRMLRLSPPTTGYTVERAISVPMRDGIDLVADHYAPATARPRGTILVRGPYGRSFPFSVIYAQIYAARGYHVVFQSVRGTFGSGGTFEPMCHEAADAADTVAWLREQSWFTGSFATLGLSYLGFTQWALLSDPPPELAAAVIAVGPHDLYTSTWGSGAFALNDFLGWADMMAHQQRGPLHRLAYQVNATRRLRHAARDLPLGAAGRRLLGAESAWYESWLEHPDGSDPFWAQRRMTCALERCTIPVLLLTGWQDVFLDQTLEQFAQLQRRGIEVAMTVGPWTHDQMVTHATTRTARQTLSWLSRHLDGQPERRAPVRIHLTGSRPGSVDLPDWPPETRQLLLHPQPHGGLSTARPAPGPTASFRFDPADPTPTVGGRLLSRRAGYRDDTALAGRSDVLCFTSTPIDGDLTVCGRPSVELDYDCGIGHFDVFVRVSEVGPGGRSRNVSDGYQRFFGPPDTSIRLELDAVAHRFSGGSRIRLLVAGGSHPRFARNLGTGEPAVTGHRMAPAVHTLRIGPASRLSLPVADID